MIKSILFFIQLLFFSYSLASEPRFVQQQKTLTGDMYPSSSQELCQVAQSTKQYLSRGKSYDSHANHPGHLPSLNISLEQVHKTLAFICRIEAEDAEAKRPSRLHNIDFIQKHFQLIQWFPDKQQASLYKQKKSLLKRLPDKKILLTKYYIKKAQAALSADQEKPFALYALPFDEQQLSLEQAKRQQQQLTRFQYSKQEILKGVLDHKPLAQALVYLSREDLEDSLMQGTVLTQVKTKDNTSQQRLFNVHRNNGYAYDRTRKKELQDRYWYFKETKHVMGYGKDAEYKIHIKPAVTVAGDLALFGLGKLFLLSTEDEAKKQQHRLVILADTGGAFEDNGYQLDLLSGYYKNWQEYHQQWSQFPDYATAHLLLLK